MTETATVDKTISVANEMIDEPTLGILDELVIYLAGVESVRKGRRITCGQRQPQPQVGDVIDPDGCQALAKFPQVGAFLGWLRGTLNGSSLGSRDASAGRPDRVRLHLRADPKRGTGVGYPGGGTQTSSPIQPAATRVGPSPRGRPRSFRYSFGLVLLPSCACAWGACFPNLPAPEGGVGDS